MKKETKSKLDVLIGKSHINTGEKFAYVIPVEGYVEGKGYNVGIAVKGQLGYYKTDWFWDCDYKTACKLANEKNEKLGLTKVEAFKIVCSTMLAG